MEEIATAFDFITGTPRIIQKTLYAKSLLPRSFPN